jgi:Zn-dependent peptidase ImmA (M78 family)/DNA-binding XRE family transcriptional regulator
MNSLQQLRIAEKIQYYRKKAKLTQEDLANKLGLARTSVTAMEKGERKLKSAEVLQISEILNIPLSELTRESSFDPREYKVQFRKFIGNNSSNEKEELAMEEFYGYCEKYSELQEKIIYYNFTSNSIPEFPRQDYSLKDGAKRLAKRERERLNLGIDPISSLREILEMECGLLIFFVPNNNVKISGAYLFNEKLGGCIFVNSSHPFERRRFTLAHEYGHFLADRKLISIDKEDDFEIGTKKEESEKFADLFAIEFLMPEEIVKRQFQNITEVTQRFTEVDIAKLSVYFGTSFQAMANRLIALELLPQGSYKFMIDNGVKPDVLKKQFSNKNSIYINDNVSIYPYNYKKMVIDLYKKEELTEGEVAYFLGLNRLEVREFLEKEEVTTPHLDLLKR